MSLNGYVDLGTVLPTIAKSLSALIGKISYNSLTAYTAESQTQLRDWITAIKVNETYVLTSAMIHLISWQTNLSPTKDSTLT